jgi:acylglycerol lipase
MHGTADKATMPAGSRLFYETASSADKTLRLYQDRYHDLLNDLGKDEVVKDIVVWIESRI